MTVCSCFESDELNKLGLRSWPYLVFGETVVEDEDVRGCGVCGELEKEDDELELAPALLLSP